MKKKNIMLGLAIFAALNAGTYALASDNPFATVPQKTGYYQDVAALVHDGLIDGYADSDFNAKHPLTRYEMAVFTAKAMSKMQSADAADTQRIQKLMKEFQSELTDLHVRVPGVKAKKAGDKKKKSSKGPKIKQAPLNWSLSGQFRFRIDEGYKNTYDTSSSEKKKKDGADGYGGSKNHQIMYQLFNKFNIGGGWKGEIDFIGSKDSHGDKRASGENTDGMCDINKMFVTGPAFGGTTRIGRVKGSLAYKKSLVMGEYYQGIDWVTIFLFAGMLPLASAMEKTGAGKLIADTVVGVIGSDPSPYLIVTAMFILSCGLTQFMSNTAAAALLAPIGISIAQSIGVSPYPVIMAIGIAASCAFTTPVATPPNTLVLNAGRFHFMDYVKVGVPLVIVSLIVCVAVIPMVWPF